MKLAITIMVAIASNVTAMGCLNCWAATRELLPLLLAQALIGVSFLAIYADIVGQAKRRRLWRYGVAAAVVRAIGKAMMVLMPRTFRKLRFRFYRYRQSKIRAAVKASTARRMSQARKVERDS